MLPPDELPDGVQALVHVETGAERRSDGTFAKGASTVQSKGGKARKETTALGSRLGVSMLSAPDRKRAATFRRVHCATLAATVGGGVCGAGPSSIVASAALQLAASRHFFESANGDPDLLKLASQLANDSRQNLLAAHELCAKEAKGRPRESDLDRVRRELGGSS